MLAIRTRHTLPDGGVLDVSELDYRTAEGALLEGHGTRPDEIVMLERRDLYAGRDRALITALGRLERLRRGHHSDSRSYATLKISEPPFSPASCYDSPWFSNPQVNQ